jgi:ribosome maturation factor RimP
MNQWHRVIVIVLVFCIGILPVSDVAAVAGDTPSGSDQVKQQIDQYGVGANLKVQLANGKKLKGSVVSLADDSFELRSKAEESPRHIAYNNVNEVKLAKLVYRAKAAPDAVEARRVVLGLGVGKHIMVKTAEGTEYHGNILSVGTEQFTMLPDHQAVPVEIAYSQTLRMGPNLSKGAKIAIVVVVGLAIAAVIVGQPWRSE